MYLESKILEILSFITYKNNNRNEKKKTSLKVSSTDKLLLKKSIS